jgi:hypothetical protein
MAGGQRARGWLRHNQHNRTPKIKSKGMQGNKSKIAFVSFHLLFRIEAFQ